MISLSQIMATRNMENSNPRLLLSEILRKVSNAKNKEGKDCDPSQT